MGNGSQMVAMTPGGSLKDIQIFLENKLSQLTVALNGQKRSIPLDYIDDILVGQDAQGQLSSEMDDHCVTLLLEDGHDLTLYFEDVDECNAFAECLSKVMSR